MPGGGEYDNNLSFTLTPQNNLGRHIQMTKLFAIVTDMAVKFFVIPNQFRMPLMVQIKTKITYILCQLSFETAPADSRDLFSLVYLPFYIGILKVVLLGI